MITEKLINSNSIAKIPEIIFSNKEISGCFQDFPVKKDSDSNTFKLIDNFGETMIEEINNKYSLIIKGFFKKKYYCPNCSNEISMMEPQNATIKDSIKIMNQDLKFDFKLDIIICSHCSNKLFSKETKIGSFIEEVLLENKLIPDPDDGYYADID